RACAATSSSPSISPPPGRCTPWSSLLRRLALPPPDDGRLAPSPWRVMNEAPAPAVPARTLAADVTWVAAGAFVLAFFAHVFETPAEGDATVWWASAGLSAVLATAPRERWRTLAGAFAAALLAALLLQRHGVAPAVSRTLAWTAEGVAGGWLASAWL